MASRKQRRMSSKPTRCAHTERAAPKFEVKPLRLCEREWKDVHSFRLFCADKFFSLSNVVNSCPETAVSSGSLGKHFDWIQMSIKKKSGSSHRSWTKRMPYLFNVSTLFQQHLHWPNVLFANSTALLHHQSLINVTHLYHNKQH